jgi:hypothetical protein
MQDTTYACLQDIHNHDLWAHRIKTEASIERVRNVVPGGCWS